MNKQSPPCISCCSLFYGRITDDYLRLNEHIHCHNHCLLTLNWSINYSTKYSNTAWWLIHLRIKMEYVLHSCDYCGNE